ncbi:MAG: diacylglycerol kinase [Candidatus Parcubacteria bacterium]|nr:MAG: diacylglycerol kinase [Candidatus Parcubacteria bacterium]
MKNKNIFQSFKCAFEGLIYVFNNHKHFKIELSIGILVIIFFLYNSISLIEWLFIILSIFLVIFSEILNTSIEETSNIIKQEFDLKIKIVKDLSGALVLISIIFSLIVFILIFIKKFIFI